MQGIGALILFAAVQLTILLYSLIKKESVTLQKFLGVSISFGGLVYLLYPSENFELSLFHVVLMIVSGVSWGVYTLLGRDTKNATLHTMDNFIKATLLCLISAIFFTSKFDYKLLMELSYPLSQEQSHQH